MASAEEMRNEYREKMREEYAHTADPENWPYTVKRWFKITHPKENKIIPFNLYDFQEKTLKQFIDHRFNIVLKSRQMGISTLVAAYALLNMVFKNEFKILVIATTQDVAKNMVEKVKLAFDELPIFLRSTVEVVNNNKLTLGFDNGSSIKAVSASPTAGRSEALSLLIIDEMAFIEKVDEIWTAAQMTLATGGDAVLLSTPNGVGNAFHKLWVKATDGDPPKGLEPFNAIRLDWFLHPDRDQEWRDAQDYALGERQAAQECDCDFLSSGDTFIHGKIIKEYEEEFIESPLETRGAQGDYWLWDWPNFTTQYIVSADVARGDDFDNSAFHVIDVEKMEQVAEFKGKVGTTEFGRMLVTVATEWNDALLVVDPKNIGWSVIETIIEHKYENLFYSYKNDPYLDEEVQIAKNYDLKNKKDMTPGLVTSKKNRPMILNRMGEALRHKELVIKSERLLNELKVFIWKNGKPQAQDGYNDDLVMSLGYGIYVRQTALKLKQRGIELSRKALNHTHKHIYKSRKSKENPYKLKGPNGEDIDYRWLL